MYSFDSVSLCMSWFLSIQICFPNFSRMLTVNAAHLEGTNYECMENNCCNVLLVVHHEDAIRPRMIPVLGNIPYLPTSFTGRTVYYERYSLHTSPNTPSIYSGTGSNI